MKSKLLYSYFETFCTKGLSIFPTKNAYQQFHWYSTGWTLSPILFGNVLDASCQIWQFPCSSSGACELYDFHRLRLSFHGISIAMKFMALGCIVLLIMLTRKWQNWKFSNNYNLSKTNEDVHDTGEEMKLTRFAPSLHTFNGHLFNTCCV